VPAAQHAFFNTQKKPKKDAAKLTGKNCAISPFSAALIEIRIKGLKNVPFLKLLPNSFSKFQPSLLKKISFQILFILKCDRNKIHMGCMLSTIISTL
jgi:hypothetical protein